MPGTAGKNSFCPCCNESTFHTVDLVSADHKIRKCHVCGQMTDENAGKSTVVKTGRAKLRAVAS